MSSMNDNNDVRTTCTNIAKKILLSSPPGQFQQMTSNLQSILNDNNMNNMSFRSSSGNTVATTKTTKTTKTTATYMNMNMNMNSTTNSAAQLLNREFISEIQSIYNSTTGREVLLSSSNDSNNNNDYDDGNNNKNGVKEDDEFGNELKNEFSKYIETNYSAKGVDSNYTITVSSSSININDNDNGNGNNNRKYDILLYAERIKLKQYHAGSWFAKYTILHNNEKDTDNNNTTTINGTVQLHAHAFENGDVQLKSNITLPSYTCKCNTSPSSSTTSTTSLLVKEIMNQIQTYEEQNILSTLHAMYEEISTTILKKIRRIMPVTRTRFDWDSNVEGHGSGSFVKDLGIHMNMGR